MLSLNVFIRAFSIQKKNKGNNYLPIANVKFKLSKPLNLFLRLLSVLYLSCGYDALYSTKVFFFVYIYNRFFWLDYIL